MWLKLDEQIHDYSKRIIAKHEAHARQVSDENRRRNRRSAGTPELLQVQTPDYWTYSSGFNPYIVRSRRTSIGHAISIRLRNRTYEPFRPALYRIPKGDGETRSISTFQIADEVVSQTLLRSLLKKNLTKFSGHSYAYRSDRNAHDAIEYVAGEFRRNSRLFIAEYDFKSFFDNLDHDYLIQSLDRANITRTPLEEYLIRKFLSSQVAADSPEEYSRRGGIRTKGLPQGTSISLFLANLAASELDRKLERRSVNFARFADDTVIWSNDYSSTVHAAQDLEAVSTEIGAPINYDKSKGIRILKGEGSRDAELPSTTSIEFLGHSIGLEAIRMRPDSIVRFKQHVNRLLYSNLILELKNGTQSDSRFGNFDLDYAVYIWQLRRYLYGPLSEREIRRYQSGSIPPMSFEGIMSFFPLIDDDQELACLDGWVATQTWLTLRKRHKMLSAAQLPTPPPLGWSPSKLGSFKSVSRGTGDPVDLRLPSLRRAANVVRGAIRSHGLRIFSNQTSLYLYHEKTH